jgi:alkylhydroperoxidase family enzyme
MVSHTGMLSWSAQETETDLDVRAVADPSIDPRVPGGPALLRLVDAALAGAPDLDRTAQVVRSELGDSAFVDAAAVIGNFQMMNRVADATGMPLSGSTRRTTGGVIDLLGMGRFDHVDVRSDSDG